MTVSRRSTIRALGAVGGVAAASGTVFARGEHEDDEREPADDDASDEETDEVPELPETAVRIAHLSPDAPNVDVYVDGDRIVTNIGYGTISPYLAVEYGTRTVTITATDDPDAVVFEGDIWFGQSYYTVAAIGELGAETFRPHVLVDAITALRVVHASPDAPAVDIYANGGDSPVVEDLSFGESTDYVALPAATYTFDVRPAGDPETTAASFEATLEPGAAYTGFATGYLEPPTDVEDREFEVLTTLDGPLAAIRE